MNQADATHPPEAITPSSRSFWLAYVAGWAALAGLYSTEAWTGADLYTVLVGAMTNVLPRAILGLPLAFWRRSLFRPEWSLGRTFGIQALLGVAFAMTTAAVATYVSFGLFAEEAELERISTVQLFIIQALQSIVLYCLLAGFLMWTESMTQVQESRQLAAREAVLRAKAELKALRAQFNPHFVFNTLHSLMLLIRAEPERAERAIEDVAGLIRYASVLQRDGVDTVPLSEELGIARRYVALERLRLEDRLDVVWNIDTEAHGHHIPAFAVQTLLENAIKHGVSPMPEGATIRVTAQLEGQRLLLSIEDDGAGTEPASVAAAKGHGIDLLQQRLAGLYGDAAELSYETAPGSGFRISLFVPANSG